MKHIAKFTLFEEVNPKDISFIESLDSYFTISFEFEIETQDRTNIKMDFNILEEEETIEDILNTIKKELKITKRSEKRYIEDIVYSIVNESGKRSITNEIFFDIFDTRKCENIREIEILSFTKNILMSHISVEDIIYLTNKSKEYLPNFTKKWIDKIDFVEDATLDRGIEIKNKTYLSGISEGIEMINDFYFDLNKQKYWSFSSRTGLHINIGVSNPKAKWNPIKGLLMLNDYNEGEKPPLVFKDMIWRINNSFCGSLIPSIKNMGDQDIKILKDAIKLDDLQSSEKIMNTFLTNKINKWGYKNFGFNITKLKHNYIEFRYAGGDIPKDILIEKLKYFTFVVYTMTNPEYKKREYLKKFYKFIDTL
jgi:hypothetical protein